jgi:GT2 family glycosyltransferase
VTGADHHKAVSGIVVTFNSEDSIVPCLNALASEIESVGGEIILFDNHSSDATVKIVRSRFPAVHIHESDRNVGFAAANNAASKSATGKYLLFANPDMTIDRGALNKLLETIQGRTDAGAVVARMRNPDGSFQPTARMLPTMKNIFFSRGSVLSAGAGSILPANGYTLGDYKQTTEVPAASATCLLIEREVFHSLRGFDERFFLFMEDTDLCLRIEQSARKIYFVPEAGAVHRWGTGSSISALKRSWYHHRSVWKYFVKHYPNGFSLFLLPVFLFINFMIRAIIGPIRK